MNKYSKRVERLLIVVALLFSVLFNSISVSAMIVEQCGDNVNWSLSGVTLTISGNGAMYDYGEGNFAPWYSQRESIEKVIISDGVTTIGSTAFYDCMNLKSVSMTNSVTSIGDMAFLECDSLEQISLSNNITYIGDASFKACGNLKNIILPSNLQKIGYEAFFQCESLSSISIPSSVTIMEEAVFRYCSNLLQVNFNASITTVPNWTFYGCTSLYSINFGEKVNFLGEDCFEDCENLSNISTSNSSDAVNNLLKEQIQEDVNNVDKVINSNGNGMQSTFKPENNDSIIQKDAVENDDVVISGSVTKNENGEIDSTIDAVIKDNDGWDEVINKTEEYIDKKGSYNDNSNVQVNVFINSGEKVDGFVLEEFAGQNVNLVINGDVTVEISCSQLDPNKNYKDFSLEYTLEKVENPTNSDQAVLNGCEGYYLKFKGAADFDITVKIHLGSTYARNYATLYQKDGDWQLMQSVKIDSNGNASFYLSSYDYLTKYLIGINIEGVDSSNALIPEDLYEEYGGLMDAYGNKYVITGSESRWGISVGQFTLILMAVMILIVSIVGITMYVMHKSKINKEKIRQEVMKGIKKDSNSKKDNLK